MKKYQHSINALTAASLNLQALAVGGASNCRDRDANDEPCERCKRAEAEFKEMLDDVKSSIQHLKIAQLELTAEKK